MAFPDITTIRSYGSSVPPTYITTDIPDYYTENQAISIASAAGWYEVGELGQVTTDPLGTSGPFVVTVNPGAVNEEDILCLSVDVDNAFITVWYDDEGNNGRGYGSFPKTHYHQTTQLKNNDIFHGPSAVEQLQFNRGVAHAVTVADEALSYVEGLTGPQGPQGAQGEQGDPGLYESDDGIPPDQDTVLWLDETAPAVALQGPQGPQGAQGYQGNDGSMGNQGSQGAQGDFGPQGPQGVAGPMGNQGPQGPQGNTPSTSSFVTKSVVNDVSPDTAVTLDALQYRLDSLKPQITITSGSTTILVSMVIATQTGTLTAYAGANGGTQGVSISSGTWYNLGSGVAFSKDGDVAVIHVTDTNNSTFHRVTYMLRSTSGGASIIAEKLI